MNAQHTLSMQTVDSTQMNINPHLECVTNATKHSSLRILHDMHFLAKIFRASKYQ
jgi:hypothetical protein